jgi:antitoxin VapB
MTLNIRNPEADRLARRLAAIDDSSITDAVVTALREALSARHAGRTAEIAASVRERFGIVLTEQTRKPISAEAWEELHDDPAETN